jgi:hypothetical protein
MKFVLKPEFWGAEKYPSCAKIIENKLRVRKSKKYIA